jgi:hypothetical protein
VKKRSKSVAKTTPSEVNTEYDSNALNQYTRTEADMNVPAISNRTYDADGNMSEAYILGDMNCDGVVSSSDQTAYNLARSNPSQYASTYPTCDILNGDVNGDGVLNKDDDDLFAALLSGGNAAMYQVYTWDAENRLSKVEPGGTPQSGQYKAEYKYDWQGRRIEKQVWSYSNGWTQTEHWKLMYADWLPLLELDGLDSDSVERQYTWGLDLSGQMGNTVGQASSLSAGLSNLPRALTAAGGIAGLLSVHDDALSVSYVYFADVQGNIGQIVDLGAASASASMMAKYQYDAYGNRSVISSTYTQPFGFATKFYDSESGFITSDRGAYAPGLGRGISRGFASSETHRLTRPGTGLPIGVSSPAVPGSGSVEGGTSAGTMLSGGSGCGSGTGASAPPAPDPYGCEAAMMAQLGQFAASSWLAVKLHSTPCWWVNVSAGFTGATVSFEDMQLLGCLGLTAGAVTDRITAGLRAYFPRRFEGTFDCPPNQCCGSGQVQSFYSEITPIGCQECTTWFGRRVRCSDPSARCRITVSGTLWMMRATWHAPCVPCVKQ